MKEMKKLLILANFFAFGFPDKDTISSSVQSLLSQTGHTVATGNYSFFSLNDCKKYKLDTCFALNPSSPYGMVHLPKAPGETDYNGCNVAQPDRCGYCPDGDNWGTCIDGRAHHWRMDKGEAFVMIGKSPPKCEYWGITNYVNYKFYPKDFQPTYEQKNSMKCKIPGICQVFASVGEALNMKLVEEQIGSGFDQEIAIVVSTDLTTEQSVVDSLLQSGLSSMQIFKMHYPDPKLNLGIDTDQRDTLSSLTRVAMAENSTLMQEYYDSIPFNVLRITPPKSRVANPTKDNVWKSREASSMETCGGKSYDEVGASLDELATAIEKVHNGDNDLHAHKFGFNKPFFDTGYDCINGALLCNGDTHDTLYPISDNIYNQVLCDKLNVVGLGFGIGGGVGALVFILQFATAYFVCERLLCCNGCCKCTCCKINSKSESQEVFTELEQDSKEDEEKSVKSIKGLETRNVWCFGWTNKWWIALLLCLIFLVVGGIVGAVAHFTVCVRGNAAGIDKYETDYYVLYGVNHAKCNKATYSSMVSYNFQKLSGLPDPISSVDRMEGSTNSYLGNHALAPYLWASVYARNCAPFEAKGLTCTLVPFDGEAPLPKGSGIGQGRVEKGEVE